MEAYTSCQQPTGQQREKSRAWVFTINHPEEADITKITAIPNENPEIVQIHVGREIGSKTGTEHLQGFLKTKNPTTRKHISKIIGGRAWIETRARGSSDEAAKRYALKDDDIIISWPERYEEIIPDPSKRERTKQEQEVKAFIDRCKKATDAESVLDEFPVVGLRNLHFMTTQVAKNQLQKLRIWGGKLPQKNTWLWGAPGLGKTRWAFNISGQSKVFTKSLSKWWDGYHPETHEIVLIDEFSPEIKGLTSLLKIWADRYPTTQQVKNGTIALCPGCYHLIVTSNYSIHQCFPTDESGAIARRFNEVNLTKENQYLIKTMKPDLNLLFKWQTLIEAEEREEDELEDAIIEIEERRQEVQNELQEAIYWGTHEEELNQEEDERIFSIEHAYE
jgi:hypothetical protein